MVDSIRRLSVSILNIRSAYYVISGAPMTATAPPLIIVSIASRGSVSPYFDKPLMYFTDVRTEIVSND